MEQNETGAGSYSKGNIMSDKIQVGENVWIKPNRGCAVPQRDAKYFVVLPDGRIATDHYHGLSADYSAWNSGNFFLTREAAEAAIIKTADPTPITYEQWVAAERCRVYLISPSGSIVDWKIPKDIPNFIFTINLCWLTTENAQAWLDKWNAEQASKQDAQKHGVKE